MRLVLGGRGVVTLTNGFSCGVSIASHCSNMGVLYLHGAEMKSVPGGIFL